MTYLIYVKKPTHKLFAPFWDAWPKANSESQNLWCYLNMNGHSADEVWFGHSLPYLINFDGLQPTVIKLGEIRAMMALQRTSEC